MILVLMAGSSVGVVADLEVGEVLCASLHGRDVLRADLLFFSYSAFCLLGLVLLAGRTRCHPQRQWHAFRFLYWCTQTSV